MSRPRKRGSDMGSKKCTLTGLGRDDGIVLTVILHKTRRHVHQLAVEALSGMLSARCSDGGVKLKGDVLLIRCGAPLSGTQVCDCWIGVDKFSKLAKHNIEIAEYLQKLWFCANERAGRVAYCPRSLCVASGGFVLDSDSARTIVCPQCTEKWCAECKEDHVGECGGINDTTNDVQRCPDCKEGCWKDSGCDHMQCLCGCYFCYVCGMRITDKYNYHVQYSPDHGTYVCPQRMDIMASDAVKMEKPIRASPEMQLTEGVILIDDYYTNSTNIKVSFSKVTGNMFNELNELDMYFASF